MPESRGERPKWSETKCSTVENLLSSELNHHGSNRQSVNPLQWISSHPRRKLEADILVGGLTVFTPGNQTSSFAYANSAGAPPVCQNKTVSPFLKTPLRIKSTSAPKARPA